MAQNGDAKNCERILEAIDQLRRRKARPDIQRICNYLFRRFAINSAEAKNDLQWCVDNKIVLRVEYKGSISYRNAAKKLALSNKHRDAQAAGVPDKKTVTNNRKFAQLLTNAFGELMLQEPDYLETGVPAPEIIANILSKDSVRYTKKYISILMDKEVEQGGLIRMPDGNYLMGPSKFDRVETSQHKIAEATSPPQPPQQWHADDTTLTNSNLSHITNTSQSDFNDSSPNDETYYSSPHIVVQVKQRKKPGPKAGFKRRKSADDTRDSDDRRTDGDHPRVGGRRKVSDVSYSNRCQKFTNALSF